MNPRTYFPLGKAHGVAFCNRIAETRWLVGNLENGKHSLLIAPRRYGKSSLAERAIEKAHFPFVRINFHLCASEEEVTQLIINSVTKLIGSAIGPVEKIITSIKKYITNLNPKLSLGDNLATLELTPKAKINNAQAIAEALLLLEKLLEEKNKKAVIFFDEFQEITKISDNSSIEGAIRTAAQEMRHLTIIFSGSIRSLLLSMFDDENRPLYKLCRKLKLERIAAQDYQKHINKVALETWQEELANNVFTEIMLLSQRHPYYVNYLCDIIWEQNNHLPTVEKVRQAWSVVIEEEWGDAVKEIALLPLTQRKILKFIARNNVKSLANQEVSRALHLALSTIASAINVLVEKDYIEVDEQGYFRVINPLLLSVLAAE